VRPDVTDSELTVLEAFWCWGSGTLRELTDVIYPGGSTSHYATVGKLLERLEGKACVQHESRGRVNVFGAVIDRSELIAHRLRETADRLCKGSLTPLLTQLVSTARLSQEEIDTLRELVNRMDDEPTHENG